MCWFIGSRCVDNMPAQVWPGLPNLSEVMRGMYGSQLSEFKQVLLASGADPWGMFSNTFFDAVFKF